MANKDQAVGLKPHGRVLRQRPYVAGSAVYQGDAVALAADGQVDPASSGALIGVALSNAAAGEKVIVADEPNQLFEVQADEAIALADVGLNADLQGHAAPSTAYKRSGMELDSSTKAVDSTLVVQILGIVEQADNEANAVNNDVIVRINVHQLNNAGRAGI